MSVSKDKKRGTWLISGYYRDATGTRQHYCRRGFETKREAKEESSHNAADEVDKKAANFWQAKAR